MLFFAVRRATTRAQYISVMTEMRFLHLSVRAQSVIAAECVEVGAVECASADQPGAFALYRSVDEVCCGRRFIMQSVFSLRPCRVSVCYLLSLCMCLTKEFYLCVGLLIGFVCLCAMRYDPVPLR